MIQIVSGDLMTADADAICQQVNCRNVMGAGLAKSIYTKWPAVKESYHRYCEKVGDPYSLLGSIQIVRTPEMPFDVVNVFGQLNYGRTLVRYTDYRALKKAFRKIQDHYDRSAKIAFPYGFGCGLAGGDWNEVLSIIEWCLDDHQIIVYKKL